MGKFEFRVTLPGYLRDGDVEASSAHGVLNIYVPKAESTKSSKIKVSESDDSSSSAPVAPSCAALRVSHPG
ncbi:hypothetical protein A5682_08710 [Mycobacterium mantenii]|nr:hypothetical protein A5687_10900 [Mycobacterium mantenii]OBH71212.1 hypothetical protein A5682_08710 [Mycobacterium mantenii]